MQDQCDSTVSFSPSFNSYSTNQLADIAAKVGREEDEDNKKLFRFSNQNSAIYESSDEDDDDDGDFEFVLVRANPKHTISGSDYPVFPLFNRDLLLDYNKESQDHEDVTSAIRLPLKKLFIDNRDPDPPSSSSSSSEADELDGIVPGTYCFWSPAKSPSASPSPSQSPSRCKKSNSTGSSSKQRWRLRDLLHLRRSSSDGKESFVFMNPDDNNNNHSSSKKEDKIEKGKNSAAAKAWKGKGQEKVSAHEVFYVRKKKEGDKRKSYLPYRQGLVGFFSNSNSNVNGLGKTFPSF